MFINHSSSATNTLNTIAPARSTGLADEGSTANDVESASTTAGSNTGATETATAVIVTEDEKTSAIETVEAVTSEANGTETVAENSLETSTTVLVENGTDVFTIIKPGNGHTTAETDASNETATVISETINADNDTTTIDADDTNETTTSAPVQPVPGSQVELRVVVSPTILQVQRGQTYELTCDVYGADASTNIYWIQEEPERRHALIDPADVNDKQVKVSQISIRARITIDDPSKIGKYTCTAYDAAGNSGSAMFTMEEGQPYYPSSYPSGGPGPNAGRGYLRIIAPVMANGDYVEIQCEGAAPEDEGRIQWFFNNRLLNDEQPFYPRGKTLHIRPISRPYLGLYRCSIPGSSYVDANSVLA